MDPQFLRKGKYPEPKSNFYETSKDPFSQKRLEILVDCFIELEEMFPGVDLAFSLVGSLAKGRKLSDKKTSKHKPENSDIDLAVLYDGDKLRKLFETNPKYYSQLGLPQGARNLETSNAFFKYIENFIFQKMFSSKETGIIKESQISIEFCSKKLAYDFDLQVSVYRFLFGRDIGGGLRKYIVGLLQESKKLSKEQEGKFWESVVNHLTTFIRNNNITEKVKQKIPKTLHEARVLYGVE